MMMRRRRPLLRAAMVGGVASHAGTTGEQAASAAWTPASPPGLSDTAIAQLEELGQLKDAGVLTQEEFEAQKQQLLAF